MMTENDRERKAHQAREWKRVGLAWLFWGVAGFTINAIPFLSHEQLRGTAEFAAILSGGALFYYVVGIYEKKEVAEDVLGMWGLTWGHPVLAVCVLAGGFAMGHFFVTDPSVLHSEFADRMFLIHGGVVVAFVAAQAIARGEKGVVRVAQVFRRIGNVTGALALWATLACVF